jgi:hypothetical protein
MCEYGEQLTNVKTMTWFMMDLFTSEASIVIFVAIYPPLCRYARSNYSGLMLPLE